MKTSEIIKHLRDALEPMFAGRLLDISQGPLKGAGSDMIFIRYANCERREDGELAYYNAKHRMTLAITGSPWATDGEAPGIVRVYSVVGIRGNALRAKSGPLAKVLDYTVKWFVTRRSEIL